MTHKNTCYHFNAKSIQSPPRHNLALIVNECIDTKGWLFSEFFSQRHCEQTCHQFPPDKKTHGSDWLWRTEAGKHHSKNTCLKILGEDLLRRPHKSTGDIHRKSHYSTLSLHRACTSLTQALHHGVYEPSPVALVCFMRPALVAQPHSSNGGNENCWGRQIDGVHLRPRFKPAPLLLINRGVLIYFCLLVADDGRRFRLLVDCVFSLLWCMLGRC